MANNEKVLNTIDDFRGKEQLEYLYWKKGFSLHEIAKMYNVTHEAIRYWTIKNKIKLRKSNSLQKEKHKISEKLLRELYVQRKLPTTEIARRLNIKAHSTIVRKLIKYDIPLRTMSEAKTIYPKKPFSGDLKEKAYMLGLRTGDLSVHSNYFLIRVITGTTHLAQIKMMEEVFRKYTRVLKYFYTNKRGIKECNVYCDLDKSFKFLLEKIKEIPNWIINNDEYFFSFLAGYSDAEGSFDIYRNTDSCITFHFRLASQDKKILEQIKDKLINLGFRPYFSLFAKVGDKATYGNYTKNIYALRIFNKKDILKLVEKLLPLSKHEEKVLRTKFILKIRNMKNWNDVKNKVIELRKDIKESRIK